jgi:uncharacterized protein DUF6867
MMQLARLISENNFWIFFFLTVVFGGGAAFLSGRTLAQKWRPIWQAVVYMLLLGLAVRFFHYSLFNETLLSPYYFAVDSLVLIAIALLGYRLKRVSQMTTQYGWIYEKTGPLTWRERQADG